MDMTMIKLAVEKGGGIYKGYQEPYTMKSGKVIGDMVYFDSPVTKSTLVLKLNVVTADTVREKIAESNAKFEVAA